MDTKRTDSFEFLPDVEVERGEGREDILSVFIKETDADPSLAQDILSMAENNLALALEMYRNMMAPPPATHQVVEGVGGGVREGQAAQSSKRRVRKKRRKGIVCVGEEVTERFREEAKYKCSKVDVGEELVAVIDDKFFQHTFLFPDLSGFSPPDLVQFLCEDLTELSHQRALERTGRLNWWSASGQCPPLQPLATSGDGNCLLHAASLGMWGVPDHSLVLRSAVHAFLRSSPERAGVRRRWQLQVGRQFQEQGGFTLGDEEWDREWAELIRIAHTEERVGGAGPGSTSPQRASTLRPSYESLEEVHVLALAHVLKRPVIVLANTTLQDMHGQDFAPIYFSGVYLPLEYNPKHCFKSPVVLAYEGAHFSPLLVRDQPPTPAQHSRLLKVSLRNQAVIPLVSPDGHMLPLQFAVDPKKDNIEEHKKMAAEALRGEMPSEYITLLESYTDVRWTSLGNKKAGEGGVASGPSPSVPWQVPSARFPAAQILYQPRPSYQEALLKSYFQQALGRFEEHQQEQREMEEERARARERAQREGPGQWERMPCRRQGCDMFGSHDTDFLCSRCYHQQQQPSRGESPPPGAPPTTIGNPASNCSSTASVASTQVSNIDDVQPLPPHPSSNQPSQSSTPVTTPSLPNVASSKPGVASSQPGVASSQPGVASSQPGVASSQPGVASSRPGVASSQPGVASSRPGVASSQPGVASSRPGVVSSQLGVASSQPGIASSQPVAASDEPPSEPSGTATGGGEGSVKPPAAQQQQQARVSGKASAVASRIAESVQQNPAPKRPPYSRGYSRDAIRPLGRDEVPDEQWVGSKKRPICKGDGCDFFASENYQGFCSKCFHSQ